MLIKKKKKKPEVCCENITHLKNTCKKPCNENGVGKSQAISYLVSNELRGNLFTSDEHMKNYYLTAEVL